MGCIVNMKMVHFEFDGKVDDDNEKKKNKLVLKFKWPKYLYFGNEYFNDKNISKHCFLKKSTISK